MNCPCCSGKRHAPHTTIGVYVCEDCGAIHGQCYLGDSFAIVLPYWDDADPATREQVYFDLDCLGARKRKGSKGIERRHGWFNPATRKIIQVG